MTHLPAFRLGENNSKQSNRQRINLKNIQATPAAQLTNEGIGTRQGNNLGYVTEEMPDEIWPTVAEIKARGCLN